VSEYLNYGEMCGLGADTSIFDAKFARAQAAAKARTAPVVVNGKVVNRDALTVGQSTGKGSFPWTQLALAVLALAVVSKARIL